MRGFLRCRLCTLTENANTNNRQICRVCSACIDCHTPAYPPLYYKRRPSP